MPIFARFAMGHPLRPVRCDAADQNLSNRLITTGYRARNHALVSALM
jgi:hypothetical protein